MIKKIFDKMKNVLEENLGQVLIITFFNFAAFSYYRYFLDRYREKHIFIKILRLFFSTVDNIGFCLGVALVLAILFKKRTKNILMRIITVLSVIFGIVDIFLLTEFNSYINTSTVQILFETNVNEGREFLETYLNFGFIGILLVLVVGIFIVSKIKWKIKSKVGLAIITLFSVAHLINESSIERSLLYRSIEASKNSLHSMKIYRDIAKNLVNDVKIIKNEADIDNIVVILGESTSRNHMSLYGYEKDTNPLLKKIEKEGNLYVFDDVISPHVSTLNSLKKVLTFNNHEDKEEWYKRNSIVNIMKSAGYKTFWLSNQESFGLNGNVAASIGRQSDTILFNRHRGSEEEVLNAYDGEIVEKSKKIIDQKNKNFIVYHLMGTHSGYKNRYPDEFKKFSEKEYNNTFDKDANNLLRAYDNAVLYNDFVIAQIIEMYKDTNSIVFYFSDHAEEVFDFRDFKGHNEGDPNRYMAEIPFMIYVSEKTMENHPDLDKRISQSLNKPYMTDDFIHTLLDIVKIETSEYDRTRSVVNEDFNSSRERFLSGKSYDNYYKNLKYK